MKYDARNVEGTTAGTRHSLESNYTFFRGDMLTLTTFLSRLIGIYCIIVGTAMALHKAATLQMVVALVNDPPVMYLFGLIVVAVGLAMVLHHNFWRRGPVAAVVTLIGWTTLLKGLLFLLLPPPAAAGVAIWGPAYQQYYYTRRGPCAGSRDLPDLCRLQSAEPQP